MAISVSQVLAYAETKGQIAAGSINNASVGVPMLNDAISDFRTELIKNGVDAATIKEVYIPSVTPPTIGGSTFSYPTDFYFLKTIEVNMSNTQQSGYVQAQQVDAANTVGQSSFDYLRANQSSLYPLFDDRGAYYEIFPTFTSGMNLTNAIKLLYFAQPTAYASTSDNLVYPDTLDWYVIAMRVASLFYQSLNKFDEANFWNAEYNKRLEKFISTLDRGSQQPIQAQGLKISGWQF